jgi:hypothetical protein
MEHKMIIVNETAYENAIARNIRMNAAKTRSAKWMALDGAKRINDFLFEVGEFAPSYREDGSFDKRHPVVQASLGTFYATLIGSVTEWGGLTGGQHDAALDMIKRGEERVVGWAAKRAAEAALSNWIGTVGKREVFALTIQRIMSFEGQYGVTYIHIMHDKNANVVIYKGTKVLGEAGEFVTIKATVKEHGEREGMKQTKIARPA